MVRINLSKARVLLVFLAFTSFASCSGRSSSTVSTTEVRREDERARYDDEPTVEVTKTEEITKEEEEGHGLFGILGDIISLPFRAIGSIL